jgi:lipoate-protein ligase B
MTGDQAQATGRTLPPFPSAPRRLDWGLTDYGQALARMRGLHAAIAAGQAPEALICLEHPPVITLGRHGNEANLRLSRDQLASRGVEVFRVERGGDVTYHGHGQAVVYLLLNLMARGLGVRPLVTLVEEAVIRAVARWGVEGRVDADHPGVWVAGCKLAALGLAVRQGVSSHGLALNVNTEPSAFDLINPCGLGLPVTSLARELGRPLAMAPVFNALYEELRAGLASGDRPAPWGFPPG